MKNQGLQLQSNQTLSSLEPIRAAMLSAVAYISLEGVFYELEKIASPAPACPFGSF